MKRTKFTLKQKFFPKPDSLTDESIMEFGMHKGKALANVPDSYLFWLYSEGKCFGDLKQYIKDNLEAIQKGKYRDDAVNRNNWNNDWRDRYQENPND